MGGAGRKAEPNVNAAKALDYMLANGRRTNVQ